RLGTGLTTLRQTLLRRATGSDEASPKAPAQGVPANPPHTQVLLTPEDESTLQRVCGALATHGQNASRGAGLWLLTSALGEITLPLAEPLRAAVDHERANMADKAAFNRRIIAARYAAVDRILTD